MKCDHIITATEIEKRYKRLHEEPSGISCEGLEPLIKRIIELIEKENKC